MDTNEKMEWDQDSQGQKVVADAFPEMLLMRRSSQASLVRWLEDAEWKSSFALRSLASQFSQDPNNGVLLGTLFQSRFMGLVTGFHAY